MGRRRRIIRKAMARERERDEYIARISGGYEAEVAAWRREVWAAAREIAARLPQVAGDDARVIFDSGPRQWWRLFRRARPIVGWEVASFKFWEPDPEGRALPAYAPGTIYIDVYRRWIAVIGLGDWMVIQADPAHLENYLPGDAVVGALAESLPEVARRYWIQIPPIATQPE